MAEVHGLRRQATTATAQALPATAVLTLRNGPTATRRPTGTADTRSLGRTTRLPRGLTRRRGHTPPLAVAIPLRLVPTPHRVAAMVAGVGVVAAIEAAVAVVAAVEAAVAVEARTAAGAPRLTAVTNLFANSGARPDLPVRVLSVGRMF